MEVNMPGTATTEKLKAPKEKVGVLLIIEGFPDHFNFDGFVGFFNHIFPVLPKGFFAGGPIEGETPYTLIHYANHEEAEVCGVAEGTPIDAFGNEYKGTYPIHSMEDHLTNDDHGYPDALAAIVLTYGHSTIDPATSKEIKGPHVDDPAGSGIGIADFIEMYGFKLMKQCFYLPGNRIPTTPHYAQWLYGNDVPTHYGYAPSHPKLANIKDALASAMPDREWVLRIGSVSYMDNRDAYGNTKMVADSTKTALHELPMSRVLIASWCCHVMQLEQISSCTGRNGMTRTAGVSVQFPARLLKNVLKIYQTDLDPQNKKIWMNFLPKSHGICTREYFLA